MKKILILLLVVISFASCQKELMLKGDDFLKFGSYYGFCVDDCVKIYVLEEGKLYKDPNNLNGTLINYIRLSDEKYNLVKYLKDYIPKKLLKLESETFGCPDCLDQGGLYISYIIDGNKGEFRLDNNVEALPDYLKEFATKIKEKLELL